MIESFVRINKLNCSEDSVREFIYSQREVLCVKDNELFDVEVIKTKNESLLGGARCFLSITIDSQVIVSERVNGEVVALGSKNKIDAALFVCCVRKVKVGSGDDFIVAIKKMIPSIGYANFFGFLFVLLIPLYSNVFNSKLIHSDRVSTVIFVSFCFFVFFLIDVAFRFLISLLVKKKVHSQMISLNFFCVNLLKKGGDRGFPAKFRGVEQSVSFLWSTYPGMIVDSFCVFIYLSFFVVFMGGWAAPLIFYYLCYSFLLIVFRFKSFAILQQSFLSAGEKTILYSSLVRNAEQLLTMTRCDIDCYASGFIKKNEINKTESDHNNYLWGEIAKVNSFLSLFFLFVFIYFAVKSDGQLWTSLVPLMLVNGRLSGLIQTVVNRWYMLRVSLFTLNNSVTGMFPSRTIGDSYLSNIASLEIDNLKSRGGKTKAVCKKFEENKSYSLSGKSGVGKTSLLKAIMGDGIESGSVLINGVSVEAYSQGVVEEFFCYIPANPDFFYGSLLDNFHVYGVSSLDDIHSILGAVFPGRVFSRDDLVDKDASSVAMSTGEKQRLIFFMSTYIKKKVLLIDEPLSNLSRDQAYNIIKDLISNLNGSILIIASHDPLLVKLCDEEILLNDKERFAIELV